MGEPRSGIELSSSVCSVCVSSVGLALAVFSDGGAFVLATPEGGVPDSMDARVDTDDVRTRLNGDLKTRC